MCGNVKVDVRGTHSAWRKSRLWMYHQRGQVHFERFDLCVDN